MKLLTGLIALLAPWRPGGLRWHHYATHTTAFALGVLLAYAAGFGSGVVVQRHIDHGSSAARPGTQLLPGTQATPPTVEGLGGGAKRSTLATGEGSGPDWCARYGGYQLGASFRGVYACGPSFGQNDGFDTVGFQCVELSVRFAYAVYEKYIANVPTGAELVAVGHAELGVGVGRPGVHSLPRPGDVLSLANGVDPIGHTAVVTHVGVDSQGNGAIDIMEENALASGRDHLDVRNWTETYGDPNYLGGEYYFTQISWLELNPGKHKPAFPVKAWDSLRKASHRPAVAFKHHGRLTVPAKYWLHHRFIGAPFSGKRFTHPKRGLSFDRMEFLNLARFRDWELTWWPARPKWGVKAASHGL